MKTAAHILLEKAIFDTFVWPELGDVYVISAIPILPDDFDLSDIDTILRTTVEFRKFNGGVGISVILTKEEVERQTPESLLKLCYAKALQAKMSVEDVVERRGFVI